MKKVSKILATLVILLPAVLRAQVTQAQKDSGWVSLFNGSTLSGLTDPTKAFFTDAPNLILKSHPGHHAPIFTDKVYAHFKVRVEFRFEDTVDKTLNAGLLFHFQKDSPKSFGWNRSVEVQLRKPDAGDYLCIGNIWSSTRQRNGRYHDSGTVRNFGGDNDRVIKAAVNDYREGIWNTLEVVVRGADSTATRVNGRATVKTWGMSVRASDYTGPLAEGRLALQAEGGVILYRKFEVMELDPKTGKPLYGMANPLSTPAWGIREGGLTGGREGMTASLPGIEWYGGRVDLSGRRL